MDGKRKDSQNMNRRTQNIKDRIKEEKINFKAVGLIDYNGQKNTQAILVIYN